MHTTFETKLSQQDHVDSEFRIVFITRGPFGALGGAATYMLPLAVSRRCDILVLSPHNPRTREKIVFSTNDISVVNVYDDNEDKLVDNIVERVREFAPNIVHVFQSPRCLTILRRIKRDYPAAKTILDFRTPLLPVSLRKYVAALGRFFFSQFYVDHILSHSINTVSSNLPIRLKPVAEVPMGISIERFSPVERESRDLVGATKFVYVGIIARQRKLRTLIQAFGKFAKDTNADVTLDVVGDGNYLERLKAFVERNKIACINFRGAMSQDEVAKVIPDYDAGIAYVPHGAYEWSPSLKSIEYAASGLPVLASDTKGHRDFATRFGFSFTFFSNTELGIVKALREFTGGARADELERNISAARRFDWDYIVEQDLFPAYRHLFH